MSNHKNRLRATEWLVDNNGLHVWVEDTRTGRRFDVQGRVGIDRVVEHMKVGGYSPKNEDPEAIAEVAEAFVEAETPYCIVNEAGTWWYTKPLRGLTYGERQQYERLSNEELRELSEMLKHGEVFDK